MGDFQVKKILLFDGQELDKEEHDYLYKFHSSKEADIFDMRGSKFVLKFVGYFEFIMDNTMYELYCFPKEYTIGIGYATNESLEIDDSNIEIVESEFKIVMSSITNASKAESTVGQKDLNKFYTSNLHYLNEIIQHYNQYGIIVETEKEYKHSPSGKINWNKTIGKVIPKFNNNNFIYDKFIVEKKNNNITFLTKLIAKVIFEGTTKYSFITPIIDTGINDEELFGIGNEVAILRLYELKNSTFKDYLHHVIDSLISYLQNDTVASNNGVLVGTNNYEFVWEHVVAHSLGSDYIKADGKAIGTYTKYDKSRGTTPTIELDHIHNTDRIIVDSKYYSDKDSEGLDYKQLYYNYHQAYLKLQDDQSVTYTQVLEEYSLWKNVLVKPTSNTEDDNLFSIYSLDDNMKLYSLKVNLKEYIEYYVNDTHKSKLRYELDWIIRNNLKEFNT
ncbi:MAG: LlaJI family restriction endonuclease [Bacilli bacterium]